MAIPVSAVGGMARKPRFAQLTMLLMILLVGTNVGFIFLLQALAGLDMKEIPSSSATLLVQTVTGIEFSPIWKMTLWFIGASALAFTGLVLFGVILPLRKISASLNQNSREPLRPLLKEPTELGEVARQLDVAFEQREALEREVATRLAAETLARDRAMQLQEVVRDRERFLQDLHDGLIQALFGIGLRLESSRSLVDTQPAEAGHALEECTREINAALQDLRRSIQESTSLLRSIRSIDQSLILLVERLNQGGRTTFELIQRKPLDPVLSVDQSTELFAVLSEACTNILRHAGARHAQITVEEGGQGILIRIEDDGHGFDPASCKEGLGLAGMEQRMAGLGGRLQLRSSPNDGTVLVLELPEGKERKS